MFPPDSRGVKRSALSRQTREGTPRFVTPRVKHLPQIPLSALRKHDQTAVTVALKSTREARGLLKKEERFSTAPRRQAN